MTDKNNNNNNNNDANIATISSSSSSLLFSSTTSNAIGLDCVNISFLPSNNKRNNHKLLLITPKYDYTKQFLQLWCKTNQRFIKDMMIKHGAILIRGFDLSTPKDMEDILLSYECNLCNTYRGTSPRNAMENTKYVFSAAEVPRYYPIAQHIEMAFLNEIPKQLFFGCIVPSKTNGGETSLCDFRKVYNDLPNDIKQKFITNGGITYTRTHKKIGSYYTFDVSDMLSWVQMFGTSNKEEVHAICQKENMNYKWTGTNHDTFVSTISSSHAYQLHPITNEYVWFNHTQVFHWTTFPAELFLAFLRTYDIRLLLHCIIVSIYCIIKYGILQYTMSLHATYGNGDIISIYDMYIIRQIIHKHMIYSRWEKSDLLLIDNCSMSHGRQPTYDSGRTIIVAWDQPIKKQNLVNSIPLISSSTTPATSSSTTTTTITNQLSVTEKDTSINGNDNNTNSNNMGSNLSHDEKFSSNDNDNIADRFKNIIMKCFPTPTPQQVKKIS